MHCCDNKINNFIDITKLIPEDYANAEVLLALDENGQLILVNRPDIEFSVDWEQINNKPLSTPSEIDDAVDKAHTHINKGLLDELTSTGDGDKFLSDDGTYKTISADETDPIFTEWKNGRSISAGQNAGTNADRTVLLGSNSSASANYTTVIGSNATVSSGTTGSIALGYDSKVYDSDIDAGDGYGLLSIGDSIIKSKRRIINVEDGINDADAATVGQSLTYSYDSGNNPVLLLQNGTKIAEAPKGGGVTHEILGINTYTDSNGSFDQFEIGSQGALFNVNVLQDSRTDGHGTADVYNTDGSYNRKEIFAYTSDLTGYLPLTGGTISNSLLTSNASADIGSNAIPFNTGYFSNLISSSVLTQLGTNATGRKRAGLIITDEDTASIESNYIVGVANPNTIYSRAKVETSKSIGSGAAGTITNETVYVNPIISDIKVGIFTQNTDETGTTFAFVGNSITFNGSPLATKEDLSRRVLQRVSKFGVSAGTITIPESEVLEIVSVNYNRIALFSDDYTYSGSVLTIDPSIITSPDADDRVEVSYYEP